MSIGEILCAPFRNEFHALKQKFQGMKQKFHALEFLRCDEKLRPRGASLFRGSTKK